MPNPFQLFQTSRGAESFQEPLLERLDIFVVDDANLSNPILETKLPDVVPSLSAAVESTSSRAGVVLVPAQDWLNQTGNPRVDDQITAIVVQAYAEHGQAMQRRGDELRRIALSVQPSIGEATALRLLGENEQASQPIYDQVHQHFISTRNAQIRQICAGQKRSCGCIASGLIFACVASFTTADPNKPLQVINAVALWAGFICIVAGVIQLLWNIDYLCTIGRYFETINQLSSGMAQFRQLVSTPIPAFENSTYRTDAVDSVAELRQYYPFIVGEDQFITREGSAVQREDEFSSITSTF